MWPRRIIVKRWGIDFYYFPDFIFFLRKCFHAPPPIICEVIESSSLQNINSPCMDTVQFKHIFGTNILLILRKIYKNGDFCRNWIILQIHVLQTLLTPLFWRRAAYTRDAWRVIRRYSAADLSRVLLTAINSWEWFHVSPSSRGLSSII